jgi:hypothetical protein
MRKWMCLASAVAVLATVLVPGTVAPQGTKGTPAEMEREHLLQTVGLLAASQVYQGYLNVGLVADGKANGNYPEKDARDIISSVVALMDACDKNLEKVGKMELSKNDQANLAKLRQLNQLVRQQATELQEFWKTGKKENSENYEKLRKEAWEGISKMLGLAK